MEQLIKTVRLTLRPLKLSDAARVMELAGDERVAATTLHVPHPYLPGMAEEWIKNCAKAWEDGLRYTYAICDSQSTLMLGVCSLGHNQQHKTAELAYWIGSAYWNKGYGTEAGRMLVAQAFETLDINKVYAAHFGSNPASGRLMEKIGMHKEGLLRKHVMKWGHSEDLIYYGLLRDDFSCQAQI
ncbi:MAG: GNAT family N-acetyltransferase [Spirochaetae bacterium HGW-Spirochaetae-8]|nr:MAG: GNAT family N-acetyltransferase [Spirochaetae bacterium HGW-Spirochaetae-8]